jgi:hypothetical protein
MQFLPRRQFLSSSFAAASAAALGAGAAQAESPAARIFDAIKPALQPDNRPTTFLTWWTDPTTTMVVQWIGDDSAAALVHYDRKDRKKDDPWLCVQSTATPFLTTNLKVHRCELKGLTPGTEYVFRIGGAEKPQRFRTMPAKANDTITFVSGGDCGTGNAAIATNIIAAKQEPYFAFIGGDLAYDNGSSPWTFLKFLKNYSQHMIDPQGRLIPMLSCFGNHEVKSSGKMKLTDAPSYYSVFDGFYRERSYGVMDIGDYLSLVLLDTGHVWPIKGEQTDWLAATLAQRTGRQHLIVANHVPAYPSYRAFENKDGSAGTGGDNRKYWCPLFEHYNVDAVLEHHDHTYKRTHPITGGLVDKYGVPYLGDGSWGQIRSLNKPENRPYLAKWSSSYHCTVHKLEGDQRFHVALAETGRVADVCITTKRPAKRG